MKVIIHLIAVNFKMGKYFGLSKETFFLLNKEITSISVSTILSGNVCFEIGKVNRKSLFHIHSKRCLKIVFLVVLL
jgi:hypothetical protein